MNNFSRKTCATFLMIVFTSLLSLHAHAVVIEVSPSNTVLSISDSLSVNVIASDLGNGVAPSIGAFDIGLDFNNSVLQFDSLTFGNGLDLGIFGSFSFFSAVAGAIQAVEVSFEDVLDLDTLQSDSFTLFTLNFTAIGNGISGLTSNVSSISDALGLTNLVPSNIVNSSVRVGTVPAPNVLALLVLGLVILIRSSVKR